MASRKPTPMDSDRNGRRELRLVGRRDNGEFDERKRPLTKGHGRMPPRRK